MTSSPLHMAAVTASTSKSAQINGHSMSEIQAARFTDAHRPVLLSSATSLGIRPEVDLIRANRVSPKSLVIGTRASALALAQAYLVQATLSSLFPEHAHEFSIAPMTTAGDKNQTSALYLFGGKALWTQELEVALMEGAIDLIVHSCKDVPTSLPEGCELGAILKREDPRDCLVVKAGQSYKRLEDLPDGSVVGTSSVRRVAQLRRAFPKLLFADVRGNLNTRLKKLDDPEGPFTAIILATAGLLRLNMADRITCHLEAPTLYYAVGQGALAIETRSDDIRVHEMVSRLIDWKTSWTVLAEREMLRVLEGGCSVPVGVWSTFNSIQEGRKAHLKMDAVIASLSGDRSITTQMEREITTAQEAEELGRDVAFALIDLGGREILEELGRKVEDAQFEQRHADAVKRAMERAKDPVLSPPKGKEAQLCGRPDAERQALQNGIVKEKPAVNGVH